MEVTGLNVQLDGRVTIPTHKLRAYGKILHGIFLQDEYDESSREKANGYIVYVRHIYGGKLPWEILRQWQRLKAKFNIGDAAKPKHRIRVDTYMGL